MLAEIVGSALGLLGALLLALNGPHAGWGFVAFLVSNVCWLAFGAVHGHWFLCAQQLGYLVLSVVGIRNWLLPPGRVASPEVRS